MCQADPGPRCHSDTSSNHERVIERLGNEKKAHALAVEEQNRTIMGGDFNAFAKAQAKVEERAARVTDMRAHKCHVLRDLDGTKTGVRKLEAQMENETNEERYAHLERRRRGANVLRPIRQHALAISSGELPRPVFALPGEHIRGREVLAAA